MCKALSYIAISSVLLLWAGSLSALAIYRWVDEAGVVHFSDMPSAKAPNPFQTVEIEVTQVSDSNPGDESSDIETVDETTNSLREELDELRRELRAQREAARERRNQALLQVVENPQPVAYGWPYVYHGNHRSSARPGMPRPAPQPTGTNTATWQPPGGLEVPGFTR